ncbi:MAG TPA: VOC family protein [Ktedonobacterales bacterium]|nr:VOC family protein [Ktedonobacterales bacterium]
MANRIVHFDVYADDVERAIAFYQNVFGWTFERVPGMDYWLITTGAGEPGIDGGLSKRENPTQGTVPQFGFTCTVDVEDVHAAFAAAMAAGGSEVHQPGPVTGVGYLAYVRDTEGNHLGLMQRDAGAK